MFTKLPGALRGLCGLALLTFFLSVAACDSSSNGTWSAPEPRVASLENGEWVVSKRPDDRFSTSNSIFATGADGDPVAMRDLGGSLWFGRWTGSEWEEELVTTLSATSESDQLVTGQMVVDSSNHAHAMFVTLSSVLYYVGEGEDGWQVLPLLDKSLDCYDVTVDPNGEVYLLYADVILESSIVAHVNLDGELEESALPDIAQACGALAISPSGKFGAAMLLPNDDYSTAAVEFFERPDAESDWTSISVASDSPYVCAGCYIPVLEYRADDVAVMMYVSSNSQAVYLTEQGADGSFTPHIMSTSGQVIQLTNLKPTPEGFLSTSAVLDYTSLKIAVTRSEEDGGFTYGTIASGEELKTPRMVWSDSGPVVSFWDTDGLHVATRAEDDSYSSTLVDSDGNDGYQLGGFVAQGESGVPQLFYSEWHELE